MINYNFMLSEIKDGEYTGKRFEVSVKNADRDKALTDVKEVIKAFKQEYNSDYVITDERKSYTIYPTDDIKSVFKRALK